MFQRMAEGVTGEQFHLTVPQQLLEQAPAALSEPVADVAPPASVVDNVDVPRPRSSVDAAFERDERRQAEADALREHAAREYEVETLYDSRYPDASTIPALSNPSTQPIAATPSPPPPPAPAPTSHSDHVPPPPDESPVIVPNLPSHSFSSHFQHEIGPAPGFHSAVRFDLPAAVTREEDVPNAEEEAAQDVGDAPLRGEDLEGTTLPLGEAVDASQTVQHEAEDVEGGVKEGGLMIIDDDNDAEIVSPALHVPSDVDDSAPPIADKPLVGATPLPADAGVTNGPHLFTGVAPPQNPLIAPPTTSDAADEPAIVKETLSSEAATAVEWTTQPQPVESSLAVDPSALPLPTTITPSSTSPSFVLPVFNPRPLSSHFQLETGPAPDFDSRVRFQLPATVSREVDVPNREEEGDEAMESVQEGSATVLPLGQAIDASHPAIHQAEDVEPLAQSGLTIVDDDDEGFSAPTAGEAMVDEAPPSPVKATFGATPPPSDLKSPNSTAAHLHNGVAPPQNPSIVPLSLPVTPAAASPANVERSPTPPLPTIAVEPSTSDYSAPDEVKFAVDDDEEEEDELADDVEEDGDVTPERAVYGLGLPEGEQVETSYDVAQDSDEEEEEEEDRQEKKEVEEITIEDSSDEEGAEVEQGTSLAPSSEPIDYRTEDERELEEQQEVEREDEIQENDQVRLIPSRFSQSRLTSHPRLQLVSEVDELASSAIAPSSPAAALTSHSPIAIHGVIEPGEFSFDTPIRFGGEGEQSMEPRESLDDPIEVDGEVLPEAKEEAASDVPVVEEVPSAAEEVGEEVGEKLQASEVQLARGDSVETSTEVRSFLPSLFVPG